MQALKVFFDGIKLPDSIELDAGTRITNLPLFIASHLSILQPGNSLAVQRTALDRVLLLKKIMKKE